MYRKVKAQQDSNVSFKHRLILNGHALHILQKLIRRVMVTINTLPFVEHRMGKMVHLLSL